MVYIIKERLYYFGSALLFVFHCSTDFLTEQALDFVLHRLGAGGAKMHKTDT